MPHPVQFMGMVISFLKGLTDGIAKESKLKLENLDGIAATAGPGLIVCITVGLNAGKAIAGSLKKPFIPVNHLDRNALSPKINNKIEFPY